MDLDQHVRKWQVCREDQLVIEVLRELKPLMHWLVRRYRVDEQEGLAAARLGVLKAMNYWKGNSRFVFYASLWMRNELRALARNLQKTKVKVEISQCDSEESLDFLELMDAFADIIDPLSRRILELRFRHGYTYNSIAKDLKLSTAGVSRRAKRSIGKIRKRLKEKMLF